MSHTDINEIVEELLEIVESGDSIEDYMTINELFDKTTILSKYIQKLHDKEYY